MVLFRCVHVMWMCLLSLGVCHAQDKPHIDSHVSHRKHIPWMEAVVTGSAALRVCKNMLKTGQLTM